MSEIGGNRRAIHKGGGGAEGIKGAVVTCIPSTEQRDRGLVGYGGSW